MKKILALALVLVMVLALCGFAPSPSFNPTGGGGTSTNANKTDTTKDSEGTITYLASNPDANSPAGIAFAKAQEALGVENLATVVSGDLSKLGTGKLVVIDLIYCTAKTYPAQVTFKTGVAAGEPFVIAKSTDGTNGWAVVTNYVDNGDGTVTQSITEPCITAVLTAAK